MAGYQTIEALRPILHRGPVSAPVVDVSLVRPNGIPRRRRRTQGVAVAPETVAYIRKRRAEGAYLRQIASELNCCQYTVRKYSLDIVSPNGKWRRGAHPTKMNVAFAKRLRRAGFTYKEIGENIGCSESQAHVLINGRRAEKRGPVPSVGEAIQAIRRITGIGAKDLRKPLRGVEHRRSYHIGKARALLIWLIKARQPALSLAQICKALGGFHHTSAMYGLRRVAVVLERDRIAVNRRLGVTVRRLWQADWEAVPA